MSKIVEMAREAGLGSLLGDPVFTNWNAEIERFAALVAKAERERVLSCYSPDDTATDWADKIRANGKTHPAIEMLDANGKGTGFICCCNCPGSKNGSLANSARKVSEGHAAANCRK